MINVTDYDAVTFDCYGTLIDWDTGVANQFGPWAVKAGFQGSISELTARFAHHQREGQSSRPFLNYRDVIGRAFKRAAMELGGNVSEEDASAFSESVHAWPSFPDTIDPLRTFKSLKLHLGVLSNVDNASFAGTHVRLAGLIDTVVTAEDVGCYKPDLRMFECFFDALKSKGIARNRILHVAQSRFHDVAPGNEIGLNVVWIDRRHGRPGKGITITSEAEPFAKFNNLEALARALQEHGVDA